MPPELEAEATRTADGVEVVVTARTLVRDLALLADVAAADAEADDALLTLLPGERAVIRVRTASSVAPERFLAPDVLRTGGVLPARLVQPVPA